MLKNVAALFCRGHQKFQPFADLSLPGELAEHWRSQRDFEGGIGFRRFHDRVRENLITSNQKLRTTRFCRLAIFSGEPRLPACNRRQLADEILFPGSACVSPKQSLEKSGMTRRRRQQARRVRYSELPLPRVSLPSHTIFFVNTSSVPWRRKI